MVRYSEVQSQFFSEPLLGKVFLFYFMQGLCDSNIEPCMELPLFDYLGYQTQSLKTETGRSCR